MNKIWSKGLLLALACGLSVQAGAKEPKKKKMTYRVTGQQVADMLQLRGHTTTLKTDNVGDPLVSVSSEAYNYYVVFYECEEDLGCASLQFRTSWALEQSVTLEWMNQYNNEQRIGRALLDSDGDPTFEYAFYLTGGISEDMLKHQVDLFFMGADAFVEHLRKGL